MIGFGQRVHAAACHLGLSDVEVARRIGISQSRFAKYIRDMNEPNLDILMRICHVLRMTPNDLLYAWSAQLDGLEARNPRTKLARQLESAVNSLDDGDLSRLVEIADIIVATERGAASRERKRPPS